MDRDDNVITVADVVARRGNKIVLNDCSLSLKKGETMSVIGPSGGGKTTLLRTILGFEKPESGRVNIIGHDLAGASKEQWFRVRNLTGVMFQQGALFSAMTVGENIAFPIRELHSVSEGVILKTVALKALDVGLALDDLRKYPTELSGGMIKRVALARTLVMDPEVVLLDEPTAGLDPISARQFVALITTLKQSQAFSILIVTHDPILLDGVSDRIAVLSQGRILVVDTPEVVRDYDDDFVRNYFDATRVPLI